CPFFHPLMPPQLPTPTLFPYTTLFRSPTFTLEANEELFAVNKYGARWPFSFEVFLNDEFQVISQLPAEMAQMGRDTEDILTTGRSEEHTSELQSRENLVCRLLLEKKKK